MPDADSRLFFRVNSFHEIQSNPVNGADSWQFVVVVDGLKLWQVGRKYNFLNGMLFDILHPSKNI